MSKLSFRARQVDYSKPLPIYLNHDLPDLQDFAAINRSVPQMPTGMEKDEEAEHHLQRALSALQAFGATSSANEEYAIPTPKVEIDNKMYERIYNIECPKQKQYIRIQPFSNDYDYPDYDADYEDENWLKEQIKLMPSDFTDDFTLFFESVMDRLEKATGHSTNATSIDEAKILLMKDISNEESHEISLMNKSKYKTERDEFVLRIYEYWKNKRLKHKHPLTPIVLTDKSGVVTQPNNPYLVFRRRTEKMQTRKNRKNEEQSYEKMLILKRDLCRAQQILRLIKKRENFKKEFLKLTLETFEKRFKLNDYDGSVSETIKCSLKPAPTSNGLSLQYNLSSLQQQQQQQQQQTSNNTNLINKLNDKNQSSIDKTIANLIHSNKLKTLGSPPHSSLKRINNSYNENYYVDSLCNSANLNEINSKLLSDKQKQRLKKEKLHLLVNNKLKTNLSSANIVNQQHNNHKLGNLNQQLANSSSNKTSNKLTVNNLNSSLTKTSSAPYLPKNDSFGQRMSNVNLSNSNIKIRNIHSDSYDSSKSNSHNISTNANSLRRKNKLNHLLNNDATSLASANTGKELSTNENLNDTFDDESLNLDSSLLTNSSNANNKLDINQLNSRICKKLNIDLDDLYECTNYDEQLKLNNIENLESLLNETRNKLSTCSEKDGYWCFKRKEGCKYLAQNGSIFKNDPFDFYENTTLSTPTSPIFPLSPVKPPETNKTNDVSSSSGGGGLENIGNGGVVDDVDMNRSKVEDTENKAKKPYESKYLLKHKHTKSNRDCTTFVNEKIRGRLKELQYYYYGYAITKHNRHLGLVRRRVGRGGRIILEKFNRNLMDIVNSDVITKDAKNNSLFKFNTLSKFKTFYPKECFELNDTNPDEATTINQQLEQLHSHSSSSTSIPQQQQSQQPSLIDLTVKESDETSANNSTIGKQTDSNNAVVPALSTTKITNTATTTATTSNFKKLKLKNLYLDNSYNEFNFAPFNIDDGIFDNESEDEEQEDDTKEEYDDENENAITKKFEDEHKKEAFTSDAPNMSDRVIFDHRLFPLYQLTQLEALIGANKQNKELTNHMRSTSTASSSSTDSSVSSASSSSTFSNASSAAIINDDQENEYVKENLDSNPANFNGLFDYDDLYDQSNQSFNGFVNSNNNLIKLDLTESSVLNGEYQSKSNEFNLNIPNIKFAIKTLIIPKILSNKNDPKANSNNNNNNSNDDEEKNNNNIKQELHQFNQLNQDHNTGLKKDAMNGSNSSNNNTSNNASESNDCTTGGNNNNNSGGGGGSSNSSSGGTFWDGQQCSTLVTHNSASPGSYANCANGYSCIYGYCM